MSYDEAKLEAFEVLVPKDGLVFQIENSILEVEGVVGGRLYYKRVDKTPDRYPPYWSVRHVSVPLGDWWHCLLRGTIIVL